MYEQVKALKEGIAVEKPIYNHVSGLLDPPELIKPPNILVIEGLHPMYDSRVRDVLDLSIYLDISNEVKFAWKIQRDMAERGHSLESIKASIEARKPDFDAYIVIEVLATQLIEDDEGKVLRLESEVDHERRGSPSEQHIHQVLRRSDAADADFPGSSNCSRPSWG